jgi:hypothetical protein
MAERNDVKKEFREWVVRPSTFLLQDLLVDSILKLIRSAERLRTGEIKEND